MQQYISDKEKAIKYLRGEKPVREKTSKKAVERFQFLLKIYREDCSPENYPKDLREFLGKSLDDAKDKDIADLKAAAERFIAGEKKEQANQRYLEKCALALYLGNKDEKGVRQNSIPPEVLEHHLGIDMVKVLQEEVSAHPNSAVSEKWVSGYALTGPTIDSKATAPDTNLVKQNTVQLFWRRLHPLLNPERIKTDAKLKKLKSGDKTHLSLSMREMRIGLQGLLLMEPEDADKLIREHLFNVLHPEEEQSDEKLNAINIASLPDDTLRALVENSKHYMPFVEALQKNRKTLKADFQDKKPDEVTEIVDNELKKSRQEVRDDNRDVINRAQTLKDLISELASLRGRTTSAGGKPYIFMDKLFFYKKGQLSKCTNALAGYSGELSQNLRASIRELSRLSALADRIAASNERLRVESEIQALRTEINFMRKMRNFLNSSGNVLKETLSIGDIKEDQIENYNPEGFDAYQTQEEAIQGSAPTIKSNQLMLDYVGGTGNFYRAKTHSAIIFRGSTGQRPVISCVQLPAITGSLWWKKPDKNASLQTAMEMLKTFIDADAKNDFDKRLEEAFKEKDIKPDDTKADSVRDKVMKDFLADESRKPLPINCLFSEKDIAKWQVFTDLVCLCEAYNISYEVRGFRSAKEFLPSSEAINAVRDRVSKISGKKGSGMDMFTRTLPDEKIKKTAEIPLHRTPGLRHRH